MSKSGNVFAFSFSNEGFEAIVNLTEIDEAETMAKLAGKTPNQSVNSILNMMSMRARFNQARRLQVYLLKMSTEFDEVGLMEWATESPQEVADLVREHGEAIAGKEFYNQKNLIS